MRNVHERSARYAFSNHARRRAWMYSGAPLWSEGSESEREPRAGEVQDPGTIQEQPAND
jgi:hypothetical protein